MRPGYHPDDEGAKREARYERGRRARIEVERRVLRAINRLDVALQFSEPSTGVTAQFLHAVHHLQRGWAGNSVEELVDEAPDFSLTEEQAEELAQLLMRMLEDARRAKVSVGEVS